MNSISEKNFELVAKWGPAVIGVFILLNVWVVMRYREVYRDEIKTQVQLQQTVNGERILESVLQDFSAHANNDPRIADILRSAQAAPAGAVGNGQRPQH